MNKPVCLGLSILELSKILMLSFGMIMQSQNIEKKQDCDIWIQTVLLYTQKEMIFIKVLPKMLKLDLILQIMN